MYSSNINIAYKIYDSEGYLICSGIGDSVAAKVGDKFKDQEFSTFFKKFDPNETYTIEILNLD